MIKQFGWAYFQPKVQSRESDKKYEIIKRIRLNLRWFGDLQLQPTTKKDDDPIDAGKGIFFKRRDASRLNRDSFDENYPFGNMIEYYDIEREKEMCLNQNTCQQVTRQMF